MLDLLWFLLPVAAAAGWFAAQRNNTNKPAAFWDYTSNFHKDLNVLLNEPGNVPGQLFEKLDDTDTDTAETHLALGNLFRRRGEIDRAILLHESLLEKQELDDEVRAAARYELGRDYESAGLFDRSEQAFRTLIDDGLRLDDAFESLLQLSEREGDWKSAIELASECEQRTGKTRHTLIAHYYCELAERATADDEPFAVRSYLAEAVNACASCPRPHLLLADLELAEGNHEEAIEHYARVEEKGPELLPETIRQRLDALKAVEDESRLRSFIDTLRRRRNAYSVITSTRAVIAELDGVTAAERFFKEQILRRPSLKGLRDWAEDQIQIARPGEKEKVAVIHAMLKEVVEDKPAYQCNSCGFRGNVLHWRCPSCGTWDSIKRIIGVEGE